MSLVEHARRPFADRPRTAAGVVLVVTAAQFLLVLTVSAALAPGYEVHGGAISDFGVISETRALFTASIVLTGVGNTIGGYAYYRVHRSRALLALFCLAGAGSVGVGVFPSTVPTPHYLAALLAFVALNVEVLACSRRAPPGLRSLGVFAGVSGLGALLAFLAGSYGALGFGGVERLVVYPGALWLLAFGGSLLGDG